MGPCEGRPNLPPGAAFLSAYLPSRSQSYTSTLMVLQGKDPWWDGVDPALHSLRKGPFSCSWARRGCRDAHQDPRALHGEVATPETKEQSLGLLAKVLNCVGTSLNFREDTGKQPQTSVHPTFSWATPDGAHVPACSQTVSSSGWGHHTGTVNFRPKQDWLSWGGVTRLCGKTPR